jgi:hypothetical protein
VKLIDFPASARSGRVYLRIRNPQRSGYYRNEVAQSVYRRARLSTAAKYPNTHVYHLTENEKRP